MLQCECGSVRLAMGLTAHLMRSREISSQSTKLLALSLTRLLFTHLSPQVLVVVLVETLLLVIVEDLLGLHSL